MGIRINALADLAGILTLPKKREGAEQVDRADKTYGINRIWRTKSQFTLLYLLRGLRESKITVRAKRRMQREAV